MSKTIKIVLGVVLSSIIVVILLLIGVEYRNAQEADIEATTIRRGNIVTTTQVDGIVTSEKSQDLFFEQGDMISEIAINEGDQVSKDDILITFENSFEIKAPFDGTVIMLNAFVGQKQSPAATSPLITVTDLDERKFTGELEESDYAQVEVGQSIDLECDIIPDEIIAGEVTEKSLSAKQKPDSSLFFSVTASISDLGDIDDNNNFTCDGEIVTQSLRNVVIVPFEAVDIVDGQAVVYVVAEDGSISEKNIEIGEENGVGFQVTSGLADGAVVVRDVSALEE